MANIKSSWESIELAVARLWQAGSREDALTALNEFIGTNTDERDLCAALGYRGMLLSEVGDHKSAYQNLRASHRLADRNSYDAYTLELSLASECEFLKDHKESLSWIVAALNTALESEGIAGGQAVRRLIERRGGEINVGPKERDLCARVVQKSWRVLGQPGDAKFNNLTEAAQMLTRLASQPRKP